MMNQTVKSATFTPHMFQIEHCGVFQTIIFYLYRSASQYIYRSNFAEFFGDKRDYDENNNGHPNLENSVFDFVKRSLLLVKNFLSKWKETLDSGENSATDANCKMLEFFTRILNRAKIKLESVIWKRREKMREAYSKICNLNYNGTRNTAY